MNIRHMLKEEEVQRLRNADPDSLQAKLYRAYRARILDATRFPEIRQSGDEKEWFHLCQPRCEGAAFLWQVERNEHLGQWVHDAAMWIADQDASDWIGPWFRNHSKPYVGMLETAHIVSAVCAALDMAGERFTEEEKERLEGQEPKENSPVTRVRKIRKRVRKWITKKEK